MLTMWKLRKSLPAVLQLKGYRQKFQFEEGSLAVFHYRGHLSVEGIGPVLLCLFSLGTGQMRVYLK